MCCVLTKMNLGAIGVAVRVLEPILWEFEATPDTIILDQLEPPKALSKFGE